jgi:hypothetical protein
VRGSIAAQGSAHQAPIHAHFPRTLTQIDWQSGLTAPQNPMDLTLKSNGFDFEIQWI